MADGKQRSRRAVFATGSVVLVIAVLGLLDRLVFSVPGPGYVFPPGGPTRTFETSEFRYEVSISSQGLRNRPVELPKPTDRVRILALGDSFTFGWGVAVEEAWPAVLERELRSARPTLEVVNCGRPGIGPSTYALHAERLLPDMGADLVLVGLTQADDLFQAGQPPSGEFDPPAPAGALERGMGLLFPGALQHARALGTIDSDTKEVWAWQATRIQEQPPKRFEALAPDVRERLLAGDLNPALASLAMNEPELFVKAVNAKRARAELGRLSDDLAKLEALCARHRATLVVVSLPNKAYVSPRGLSQYRAVGFTAPDALAESPEVDRRVAEICAELGVRCVTLLEPFRAAPGDPTDLFFAYDGHLNSGGHTHLARVLASRLDERDLLPAR